MPRLVRSVGVTGRPLSWGRRWSPYGCVSGVREDERKKGLPQCYRTSMPSCLLLGCVVVKWQKKVVGLLLGNSAIHNERDMHTVGQLSRHPLRRRTSFVPGSII